MIRHLQQILLPYYRAWKPIIGCIFVVKFLAALLQNGKWYYGILFEFPCNILEISIYPISTSPLAEEDLLKEKCSTHQLLLTDNYKLTFVPLDL